MSRDLDFVERMGFAAEADGLSRIAGRLFGALLLAESQRSLDDLAVALHVSKASVSTEARRLVERGVARRVAVAGDRRDYYSLAPDFFANLIRHRVSRWRALRELAVEMRHAGPDRPRVVRRRFDYIDAVHEFVLRRVVDALSEWEGRETPRRAVESRARPSAPSGRRHHPAPIARGSR